MKVTLSKNPKNKPDVSSLGFGKYFTDHMLVMDYIGGKWADPEIVPYAPFSLDPSTCVLHYGQGIFEGLKAYKNEKGEVTMFRPRDNFIRMNKGATRMCMPNFDIDLVMAALKELLKIDESWIPSAPGTSLYIRPTLIAKDEMLGVHPSHDYRFFIILSPVGAYYSTGLKPTKILVEENDKLIFTEDAIFNSPSAAANMVLGRNSNGFTEWVNKTGITFKEIQEKLVNI